MEQPRRVCAEQNQPRRQTSFKKQLVAGKRQNTCVKLQREKKRKKKEPRPCCILFFHINNRADVRWPEANRSRPAAPHCSTLFLSKAANTLAASEDRKATSFVHEIIRVWGDVKTTKLLPPSKKARS